MSTKETTSLRDAAILMGTRQPALILAPSISSRGVVNMAAIACSEALGSGA